MEIFSRGQLAAIIKENKVESKFSTYEGKAANFTTVYNRKKDSFHRIIWGEVTSGGQSHIWFNKKAHEVKVAPNGMWMTKDELKEYQESLKIGNQKPFDELTLMKTKIVHNFSILQGEIASSLVENEKVLLLSSERHNDKIINKILKTLTGESYELLEKNKANIDNLNDLYEAVRLIRKIKVNYEPLLNTNMIEKTIKTNSEFDLIVIDNIKHNNDNYKDVSKLINHIDKITQSSNCKTLVYTRKV